MSNAPYCKVGTRRCAINKHCVKKIKGNKTRKYCKVGSRKCVNNYCYKKNKSMKSRNRFINKYL